MIRKLVAYTITVVCLLCPQVKANQHSVSTVKESIVKQSLELGIDPALALSIAKSESGFRHEARSRGGAVGVFQLMPSTAKRLGVNPYYLSGNIKGGLMYYKKMYSLFGSTELALAAYNAGPKIVKQYNKVPPFRETKRFVSTIMNEYNYQKTNPDPAITKLKNSKNNKSNNIVNVSSNTEKVTKVAAKPVATEKTEIKANFKQTTVQNVEHKIDSKKVISEKIEVKTTITPKRTITEKVEVKTPAHAGLPAQGVV